LEGKVSAALAGAAIDGAASAASPVNPPRRKWRRSMIMMFLPCVCCLGGDYRRRNSGASTDESVWLPVRASASCFRATEHSPIIDVYCDP
jgi:hypothetical protein